MPEHQGPEPTGWELMRGLERVQQSVDALGARVVSTDLFKAHLDTDGQEKIAIRDEIRDLREDIDKKTQRDQAREDEARRFKAGQIVAIVMGAAAVVASFIVPFIHGGA